VRRQFCPAIQALVTSRLKPACQATAGTPNYLPASVGVSDETRKEVIMENQTLLSKLTTMIYACTAILWSYGLFQVLDSDRLFTKLGILVALPMVTALLFRAKGFGYAHQPTPSRIVVSGLRQSRFECQ
jgi:hypothetical protein